MTNEQLADIIEREGLALNEGKYKDEGECEMAIARAVQDAAVREALAVLKAWATGQAERGAEGMVIGAVSCMNELMTYFKIG